MFPLSIRTNYHQVNALSSLPLRTKSNLRSGQSMPEYSIILGLTVVVTTAFLFGLGTDLSINLAGMMGGVNDKPLGLSAKYTVNGNANTDTSSRDTGNLPVDSNPEALAQFLIKLGNGQTVNIANYPKNLREYIETAGVSGATNTLLAVLESVFNQLKQKRDLSPSQTDTLTQLANSGHRIGNTVDLMEEYWDKPLNTPVMYQGEARTLDYVRKQVGWHATSQSDYPLSKNFLSLYQQAINNGTLADPTLRQVVGTLVNQINSVANGAESATFLGKNNDLSMGDKIVLEKRPASIQEFRQEVISELNEKDLTLGTNTQQTLLELGVNVVIHEDSATICEAGKSLDNNNHCL